MDAALDLSIDASGERIKIIDVDSHFSEPYDLWTSRAPAKYKDKMPQVTVVDGVKAWRIDGHQIYTDTTASVVLPDGRKSDGLSFLRHRVPDVHPACSELKPRLAMMDSLGIHAQIVYPNILGFGGQNGAKVDAKFRLMSQQIFNDAMGEMQAESNGRFLSMALLPWWDVKESVKELERCAKMGARGINISSDPQVHGLACLSDPYWYPLWEACVAHEMPVNFHVGASEASAVFFSGAPWPNQSPEAKLSISSAILFMSNARIVANIIASGMLDRFPTLKFVSVESGVGWIPFILETLAYQFGEAGMKLSLTPKEYFRRQIYGCFWYEREDIASTVRSVGVDNLMFETDFPHPTCLYPEPASRVYKALAAFTPEERKKLLSTNAAKLYRIPV